MLQILDKGFRMEKGFKTKWLPIIIASIVILIITIATRTLDLDILISKAFYVSGQGFPLKQNLIVRFFYASVPVVIALSIIFFVGFAIAAFKNKNIRRHNRIVIALFVSIVIGPGIIVNTVFKDNFGRPRPHQTIEFGGKYESKQILEPNWGNRGSSFPSGHAAVPISFLLVSFALYRRGKLTLAKQIAAALIVWYVAVSFSRVAAGRHHFSDVSWAAYFSFITAWLSYVYIERQTGNDIETLTEE